MVIIGTAGNNLQVDDTSVKELQNGIFRVNNVGTHFMVPIRHPFSVVGTWALNVLSSSYDEKSMLNVAEANADAMNFKIGLCAGTYTIHLVTRVQSSAGILKIKVDDVTVATHDQYNSSATNDNVFTETGVIIADSGIKDVQLVLDGKNGSSSGYRCTIQELVFVRTA